MHTYDGGRTRACTRSTLSRTEREREAHARDRADAVHMYTHVHNTAAGGMWTRAQPRTCTHAHASLLRPRQPRAHVSARRTAERKGDLLVPAFRRVLRLSRYSTLHRKLGKFLPPPSKRTQMISPFLPSSEPGKSSTSMRIFEGKFRRVDAANSNLKRLSLSGLFAASLTVRGRTSGVTGLDCCSRSMRFWKSNRSPARRKFDCPTPRLESCCSRLYRV